MPVGWLEPMTHGKMNENMPMWNPLDFTTEDAMSSKAKALMDKLRGGKLSDPNDRCPVCSQIIDPASDPKNLFFTQRRIYHGSACKRRWAGVAKRLLIL